ncbi:S1/P1 Nuclease [Xaviernesmea oryzae]|uniref:S1/P1 Nuclease n=2 Tax=Xaviernesmea oryzae TaxID=464029 RepID=A0A1X7FTE1_9HYPH|nr:S1/P1 Nuclease [Xaviernesmea oryzae]
MVRMRIGVVVTLIAVLLVSTDAMAWGKKGHCIVARIAEDHLAKATVRRVGALLGADGSKDMASVASWADRPDVKRAPGRPMHTVRIAMDASGYEVARDCRWKRPCIVEAINHAEETLRNQGATLGRQIVALKDLIHFLGDIHQPLHTARNIGRQQVFLNGHKTMLHQVWDTRIIADQRLSCPKLAALLESDRSLQPSTGGAPEDWAVEGRDIAMREIFAETAPRGKSAAPTTLTDDYAGRHWPTVKNRLKQAGLRLAAALNRIYQ